MPDDQDGQIGWAVVRSMMGQNLATGRASRAHFEIAIKHRPRAAGRAATLPATPQGRFQRTILCILIQNFGRHGSLAVCKDAYQGKTAREMATQNFARAATESPA